jgi:hypothetical protein
MTDQFENQDAKKLNEVTESEAATEKRINLLAEKAAKTSTRAEQIYDKNNPIFSK